MKLIFIVTVLFVSLFCVNHSGHCQVFFNGSINDLSGYVKSNYGKIIKQVTDANGRKIVAASYTGRNDDIYIYSQYTFSKSDKLIEGFAFFDKDSPEQVRILKISISMIASNGTKVNADHWEMNLSQKETVLFHLNVDDADCNCNIFSWRVNNGL